MVYILYINPVAIIILLMVPVGSPENITTARTSATTAVIEWDSVTLKEKTIGLLSSWI